MLNAQAQIELAIKCTVLGPQDGPPNVYRLRSWLISEYGSWFSPTMKDIQAYLGNGYELPDSEADMWIGSKHAPIRTVYKSRKKEKGQSA